MACIEMKREAILLYVIGQIYKVEIKLNDDKHFFFTGEIVTEDDASIKMIDRDGKERILYKTHIVQASSEGVKA